MDENHNPLLVCRGLRLKHLSLPEFILNGGGILCVVMPFPQNHPEQIDLVNILSGKQVDANYLLQASISRLGSIQFKKSLPNYLLSRNGETRVLSLDEANQIRELVGVGLEAPLTAFSSAERMLLDIKLGWEEASILVLDNIGSNASVVRQAIRSGMTAERGAIMLSYPTIDRLTPGQECFAEAKRVEVEGQMAVILPSTLSRRLLIKRLNEVIKKESSRQSVSLWAEQWINRDNSPTYDRKLWYVLNALAGANLNKGGKYIHTTIDYQEWLKDLLD